MAATTATATNTTVVQDPTGGALPWNYASITTATVNGALSTENVTLYLRGTSPLSNGAVSTDYAVNASGTLTAVDQIFYQANAGVTVFYFGTEAGNPTLASTPTFTAANPGYAYTEYTYAPNGSLIQVVAAEANGKIFVGNLSGT